MLATSVLATLAAFATLSATQYTPQEDPRLSIGLTLDTPTTGVSTTPDGRLFLIWSRVDGSTGPQISEYNLTTNTSVPYPNAEWNNFTIGKDPTTHLIRINSQRIGPDGNLWLVDVGSPAFGEPVILPDGPKLVVVNVTTNEVSRIYPMGNVTFANSLLDDVRFNFAANRAYLTDAGVAANIVMDLTTGEARRVQESSGGTQAYIPISAEGRLVRNNNGFQYIYSDQLEVSPGGEWLYYQPASGGMSRINTTYIDAALHNSTLATILSDFAEPYAHTPSTGGTAIDAEGNIYNSDTDFQRIIKIAPNGTMSVFIDDPRLLWVDAMWIDSQQRLWMPAAQLNRGTPFNNGSQYLQKPLHVYTIDLGIGPSPIDHA